MSRPRKTDQTTWWGAGQDAVVLDAENSMDHDNSGIRADADRSMELFSFQSNASSQPALARHASDLLTSPVDTPKRHEDHQNRVLDSRARSSEASFSRARLPPPQPGFATPELQRKLSYVQTEDLQDVALRMFKVLKEHGLVTEAHQVLNEVTGSHNKTGKYGAGGFSNDLSESIDDVEQELLGMDYILKDGIVNYLRDVAELTPPLPEQVVRFSDINYTTMTGAPPSSFETFGAKLFNCFFGVVTRPFRRKGKPKHLGILKDVTGYIMPGSMTLLLGPPESGKSSLLKVLAGRAETNKVTQLNGSVLFNDRHASDILLTRLIAYSNGQLNKHLPHLTVRETLEFAEDCTQAIRPENFTPQLRKFFAQALVEGQDPYLEYILHVLGLKGIEHQVVGEGQDGISENDRHRLTTAEIAMGSYSVMLYDQPCLEQESVATYDLVSTLRAIGLFQKCSAVMSLVQLSPEVFDLFDRIILLGEGQILYQGPRQDVLSYFSHLGFKKPVHVDVGDFLMEIAAGEGSPYMSAGNANFSLADLVTAYKHSDMHKDVLRIVHSEDVLHTFWVETDPNLELSVHTTKTGSFGKSDVTSDIEVTVSKLPSKLKKAKRRGLGMESTGIVEVGDHVTGIASFNGDMYYLKVGSNNDRRSKASTVASFLTNAKNDVRLQLERVQDPESIEKEEMKAEHFSREYVQTWTTSTTTLIKRHFKIAYRHTMLNQLRFLEVVLLGVFTGTLFFAVGGKYTDLKLDALSSVGFVPIYVVLYAQFPIFMMQRPIFYKQREQRFFRVSSYVISQSVVVLPQILFESLIYSLGVYFLAGMDLTHHGAGFFQYLLLTFFVGWFGSSLMLALSALVVTPEQGSALLGLILALLLLFPDYSSSLHKFWRWATHLSPLRVANIAFCVTQFEHIYKDSCSLHVDTLSFCEQYPNKTVGFAFLAYNQFQTDRNWFWFSIAILTGWIIFMIFLADLGYRWFCHTSVTRSLPRQSKKVRHHMTRAAPADAKHDTASGISWAGYVLQGDDDLRQLEVGKSPKHFPKRLQTMVSMDSDVESALFQDSFQVAGMSSWRSSSIPVKPATLTFQNLSFLVKDPKTHELAKVQLDKVSGYAKPGKMLALIGGRKSGKSLLLRCLANRGLEEGALSGEILVNGFKLNSATYSRAVGFAEKLDAHQPFLTVRESLQFSAALRLGNDIGVEDKVLHIDLILDILELTDLANQLVGSLRDATGRTFELAKKITIAVELAANPSILFLDEPTSGLDGLGARNIIHAIQAIAATGRTVIATIQHPSARMLSAFSSVVLLSSGGKQVYFGPVGANCSQVLEYFSVIPKLPRYDVNQNPVTYIFNVLGCGIRTRDPIHDFSEVYKSSSLAILNNEELRLQTKQNKRNALKLVSSGYAASYQTQAMLAFIRTQKYLWRNVGYTFGRMVGAFTAGLLLGLVYFRISSDTVFNVFSRSYFITLQLVLSGFITADDIVPQIANDRLAYFRERRAGMYASIFLPLSYAIAEIPYLLLSSLIFVAVGCGLTRVGTDSPQTFLLYWLALFLFMLTMAYFGMLVTLATPDPAYALFLIFIFLYAWLYTCGSEIYTPVINRGWKWLFWANPWQFATNTLNSLAFYCNLQTPQCSACVGGQPCPGCGCAQLPDQKYEFAWSLIAGDRSLDHSRIHYDFAALGGMSILFALLSFVAFAYLRHNRT